MSIRDRLDLLSRGELAGLAIVLVVALAGAGLWYTRSLPRPIQVAETSTPPASTGPTGATGPADPASPPAAPLIVDVTGQVRKPGVYEFPAGARVIDAVERAGGAREHAELSLLNLAAPLVDGQQILVPKEGAAGTTVVGTAGGTTGGLVNINTADEAALETLSGVGPVTAAAIITYRQEHGPFTTVDELDAVSGIGPATLAELRDQVTI
jgi:competence protein ComEA